MIAIILSSVALVVAIIALVFAAKNHRVKEIITREEIIHAPVQYPFTYDASCEMYRLEGGLEVEGPLSCYHTKKK